MWICFSLLDAVMREPFNMGQDDVTVMNRPASSNVYQTLHPPNIAGDDEMWNQTLPISDLSPSNYHGLASKCKIIKS